MLDGPNDQQDPFSEIIGRALIDPQFRERLWNGDDEEQKAAMVDAGLTAEQAAEVLPTLQEAVSSIRALYEHPVFGPVRTFAA